MAKFCRYCGTELKEGATFCSNCGSSVNGEASKANTTTTTGKEPKSRVAAGLLGLLLGGFGAHNFYLGFTNRAIIQLVLTFLSCGLASLWGFIEGILILSGNINADSDGVPLKD